VKVTYDSRSPISRLRSNIRSRFYINIETKELVFCGSRDHATDMFAKFSCRRFWDVLVVLAIFVVSPPFYA
jgi:hypothetical protein